MTRMKQLCNNDPAVAIEHLIDGLVNHEEIVDFTLDFDSSSNWTNGVCAGGAATVTLIKILDMSFAPIELNDDIISRAELMRTDRRDLLDFEEAIEIFRRGRLFAIERYFGLKPTTTNCPWYLQNQNWKTELPEVIKFWEQLTGRRYNMENIALERRWEKAAVAANRTTTYAL
jgi:hypothetical protein